MLGVAFPGQFHVVSECPRREVIPLEGPPHRDGRAESVARRFVGGVFFVFPKKYSGLVLVSS